MFLLILRDAMACKGWSFDSRLRSEVLLDSGAALELLNARFFETLTSVCQMIYLHRFQTSRIEETAQFDQISQEMALQIVRETFGIPQVPSSSANPPAHCGPNRPTDISLHSARFCDD
jgi:hypothetical protein